MPTLHDIVVLLDRVGRLGEAEAVARDLIARFPRRAAGYIALADLAEGRWPMQSTDPPRRPGPRSSYRD